MVENQGLANDNKQLAILVKEYEQTLENVMGRFRVHAVWLFRLITFKRQ
jgi:hypothetical protein